MRCLAVDIQSQFIDGDPSAFRQFIRNAVGQIRKANRHIIILAGLATNTPAVQSPANLLADYNAALSAGVAGFWLNANNWGSRTMCTAAQGGPGCPAVGLQLADVRQHDRPRHLSGPEPDNRTRQK